MKKAFLPALFALLLSPLLFAAEPKESFEDVRARARKMGETDEGKAYEKEFSKAVSKSMQAALEDCTKDTKPPYVVNIVFVIDANGTAQRLVPAPNQPVSACVAKKLDGVKLPKPPKSNWMVAMNITIK
jgi:hypothetical protein